MKQLFTVITLIICLTMAISLEANGFEDATIADTNISSSGIYFAPRVSYGGFEIRVSCPNGKVFSKVFNGGSPYIGLSDDKGNSLPDGSYTYELKVLPVQSNKIRREGNQATISGGLDGEATQTPSSQSGSFTIQGGAVVTGGGFESSSVNPTDGINAQVYATDLIVQGSECLGTDCTSSESFGFDTLRLKENNLRIHFEDTSASGSFPSNDWRITINDSTNGGANYFSIDDATGGKTPFKIEAGAPNNALYVDDGGKVGMGTATPVVQLHVVDGNTPTLRLDQDGSSGWTPYIWDVAGNETNFFIRDVTSGSKLPFRIQPGTPENLLTLRANGNVGMGTWSPDYSLEVEKTGEDAIIVANRTDGGKGYITGGASYVFIGSVSEHPLRLVANQSWRMQLNDDNSLSMRNGASCTSAGVWTNASSIELKENVRSLSLDEAMNTLENLKPVRYNYKVDKEDEYVGFIAEDVPELVASKDRKGLSAMDVVAVLTKVVQQQQETARKQQEVINQLKQEMKEVKNQSR